MGPASGSAGTCLFTGGISSSVFLLASAFVVRPASFESSVRSWHIEVTRGLGIPAYQTFEAEVVRGTDAQQHASPGRLKPLHPKPPQVLPAKPLHT